MNKPMEVKCPVCDKEMKYNNGYQKYYYCKTMGCLEEGVAYGLPKIEKGRALVGVQIENAISEDRIKIIKDIKGLKAPLVLEILSILNSGDEITPEMQNHFQMNSDMILAYDAIIVMLEKKK